MKKLKEEFLVQPSVHPVMGLAISYGRNVRNISGAPQTQNVAFVHLSTGGRLTAGTPYGGESSGISPKGVPRTNGIHPKFTPIRRGSVDIGKLIGIIISLIVIGLFGYAIWWIVKSVGDAGSQYSGALVDTRRKAIAIQCQTNLHAIWQNLRLYSIENESFPPSLEALAEWGADPHQFRCPASDSQEYVYIPGQNENMPGQNVLVYELKAVHEGRCNLLRLNGQIELLTPEQVQAAVTKTQFQLQGRR